MKTLFMLSTRAIAHEQKRLQGSEYNRQIPEAFFKTEPLARDNTSAGTYSSG
jgi:hypothetical protein